MAAFIAAFIAASASAADSLFCAPSLRLDDPTAPSEICPASTASPVTAQTRRELPAGLRQVWTGRGG